MTGADGLIGSFTRPLLESLGHRVEVFGGDLCREDDVRAAVSRVPSADWVVHLAAMTDVRACEAKPDQCFAVNVEGTRRVRDVARAWGSRLLAISTVSVFSGREGNYRETDTPRPASMYDLSKALAEEAVLGYERGHVLRLNVIGVHANGSRGLNFFEWLLDAIARNEDLRLFHDVRMNPLSPKSIAACIAAFIDRAPSDRILHVGATTVASKADVGDRVVAAHPRYRGHVTRVSVDAASAGVSRPKEMWLNVDRAPRVLGISLPSLEAEVDDLLARQSLLTHAPSL